jgi:ribosomal protein L5
MNSSREARLAAALVMNQSIAAKMLDEAHKRGRRQRVSAGRVIIDLAQESAKELQSTVDILTEIHCQKPSEKRATEAVAAMRLLAHAAAQLAAASLALVVETQVEVVDLSAQLSN